MLARSPELLGMFVIILVASGVFVVTLFYLPLAMGVLAGVLFAAIVWTAVRSGLALVNTQTTSRTRGAELKGLIENIEDGVVIYDLGFKIIDLNRAFEETVGETRSQLLGKTISPDLVRESGFALAAQIIFPSLAPSVTQVSEEGVWPQVAEVVLGEPPRTLLLTLNRLVDEKGEALGFMKVVRDETRERMIIESKTEFIKIAAHQLRTPLTAIRWAFENLAKQENKEIKGIIDEGLDLSERSLKIINDMLTVSEMEEGRFGFSFEEEDVAGLVSSVIERAKPIAEERDIRLSFAAPDAAVLAKIDSERILIAISNLLDNAIRYNTKGGSVAVTIDDAVLESIKISVSDTGVGIPKSDLSRIFSKFWRGEKISEMEPSGSGLGLYIAKNIIRAHGGEIGIDSEPGRGTTIWFTLPRLSRE